MREYAAAQSGEPGRFLRRSQKATPHTPSRQVAAMAPATVAMVSSNPPPSIQMISQKALSAALRPCATAGRRVAACHPSRAWLNGALPDPPWDKAGPRLSQGGNACPIQPAASRNDPSRGAWIGYSMAQHAAAARCGCPARPAHPPSICVNGEEDGPYFGNANRHRQSRGEAARRAR